MLRGRVGLREDQRVVGDRRVGDPVLLAVQDVDVAVAARRRLHRGDVGARGRLGQAEAGELLALRLRREPAVLLLLARVAQQRQRVEPDVHRDQRAERGLAALDLLAGKRLGDEVEAGAAVLLGDHDSEQPQLGHAGDRVHVEPVVDVVLDGVRQHALVHERAHGVLDEALLVCKVEVHGRESTQRLGAACRSARAGRDGRAGAPAAGGLHAASRASRRSSGSPAGGVDGVGEDVTYTAQDHDGFPLLEFPARRDARRAVRAGGVARELFARPPEMDAARNYRRWAVESALLDLALRPARALARRGARARGAAGHVRRLHAARRPGLGGAAAPAARALSGPALQARPDGRLGRRTGRRAGGHGCRGRDRSEGGVPRARPSTLLRTRSSTGASPRASRTRGSRIPALTPETDAALEPHRDANHLGRADPLGRRRRGAAVRRRAASTSSRRASAASPSCCASTSYCAEHGIALYGGGQFELGPGRGPDPVPRFAAPRGCAERRRAGRVQRAGAAGRIAGQPAAPRRARPPASAGAEHRSIDAAPALRSTWGRLGRTGTRHPPVRIRERVTRHPRETHLPPRCRERTALHVTDVCRPRA